MKQFSMTIEGRRVRCFSCNTVVVGSGAAGFSAAARIAAQGQRDVAIVTENVRAGTSRNAGSDKQTYYKLSVGGDEPDSAGELARSLFAGGCVDGDHALAEAALSARAFFHLVELGVPFPHDRYGQYVGYKTDHDPKRRATSAGPYTSKMMTERLEAECASLGIPVYDRFQAIKILKADGRAIGVLCLDLSRLEDEDSRYAAFPCSNLVWATGGPAGIYSDSAYPASQSGATGIALEAGAAGKNLTEWQYGLASVNPRWNVSGTYMQALPRFISTDSSGNGGTEFLGDYFSDRDEALSAVFLKGYQWPFDSAKVRGGSSLIDIFVYVERFLKGRRVFLDYRSNPGGLPIEGARLVPEAKSYLKKAGAFGGVPIERLTRMNAPAVAFYRDRGVDLAAEPLEITMAAQHSNGGLSIDAFWQTTVEHLFAVGEAAASHGIRRPGGSALNAGQVGALRAARYIALKGCFPPPEEAEFLNAAGRDIGAAIHSGEETLREAATPDSRGENAGGTGSRADGLRAEAARRMSGAGAAFRNGKALRAALSAAKSTLAEIQRTAGPRSPSELPAFHRLRDILITQIACLSAMVDYLEKNGRSRGSALYHDGSGELPLDALPEMFRSSLEGDAWQDRIQEVFVSPPDVRIEWRPVRPIPLEDDFFENVWRDFRDRADVETKRSI